MTRQKEVFTPRNPPEVRIFTCGPSTYRRPHIGNYRTFMYEDLLVRYLEYLGYGVKRVINFTDVEDKTISEALSQGRTIRQVTGEVAEHFFSETRLLGIKIPDEVPRATTSVDTAVHIIESLMEKGYAYRHEDKIFFAPLKKTDFGKLFRLDMSRWPKKTVRFKKDTYNGRRWNLGDFVLWHGHEGSVLERVEGVFQTSLGEGRPSWNIQDPAMVVKHLGTTIDINCGGIDNIYRHHDYNIAIMEAYSGETYANYYLHGEHLVVNGRSMSKSRGNILYPGDVLVGDARPYHLRQFLFSKHYRRKLNYTEKAFLAERARVDRLRRDADALVGRVTAGAGPEGTAGTEILALFEEHMNEDLNAAGALRAVAGRLAALRSRGEPIGAQEAAGLRAALERVDSVLGVIFS